MSKKSRERTYARNRRVYSRKGYERLFESDGEFLLKLILCVLLASFWLKFGQPFTLGTTRITAIPVGLFLGLIIVNRFEHFQSDRKIWYAILVIIGVLSYFVPAGIVI